jgi:hypothetical protein
VLSRGRRRLRWSAGGSWQPVSGTAREPHGHAFAVSKQAALAAARAVVSCQQDTICRPVRDGITG